MKRLATCLCDFPASREQYLGMTQAVRKRLLTMPGGAGLLMLPTALCAAVYALALLALALERDARIVRALLVPAACFLVVTVLRPLINRERPYDRFGAPPLGRYRRGKGKSMPSRHAASAAAIAAAAVYATPSLPMGMAMLLLTALIAALRVLAGQHYVSDVLVALAMSFALSAAGYLIGI